MMAKEAVTSYEIFRYISLNTLGVQSINNVKNFHRERCMTSDVFSHLVVGIS